MAFSEVAVQERYKKSSKNDLYRLYLKSRQKEKALIMNALCDILWLIVIDANCYLLSHAESTFPRRTYFPTQKLLSANISGW